MLLHFFLFFNVALVPIYHNATDQTGWFFNLIYAVNVTVENQQRPVACKLLHCQQLKWR